VQVEPDRWRGREWVGEAEVGVGTHSPALCMDGSGAIASAYAGVEERVPRSS
jgi:hypothetical protein